ncbi:hypothetical protein JNB_04120 [Janibacter sp. HTCC2649]|nr:hypothetical protein JNB_04120 [Janibacter sp. HTCC2649]
MSRQIRTLLLGRRPPSELRKPIDHLLIVVQVGLSGTMTQIDPIENAESPPDNAIAAGRFIAGHPLRRPSIDGITAHPTSDEVSELSFDIGP